MFKPTDSSAQLMQRFATNPTTPIELVHAVRAVCRLEPLVQAGTTSPFALRAGPPTLV